MPKRRMPVPKQRMNWDVIRKLKVGDSFLLPKTRNARNSAGVAAAHRGIKVTVRKTSEGLRCWRIVGPARKRKSPSVVTLEKLCDRVGLKPHAARKRLRLAVERKKLGRHRHWAKWEWPKGSPEIKKVRALLKS